MQRIIVSMTLDDFGNPMVTDVARKDGKYDGEEVDYSGLGSIGTQINWLMDEKIISDGYTTGRLAYVPVVQPFTLKVELDATKRWIPS